MRSSNKIQNKKIINPYVNNQYKFKSKNIDETTVNKEINFFINNVNNMSKQKNKQQNANIDNNLNIDNKVEIECRNISKTIKTSSFKADILEDINLKIYQGEIVIILGPSGSGKTTLLNVIAGIESPTSGDVFIKGKAINKLNDKELTEFRRNHIAYIYQRYGLVPISTVWDNIKLGQNLVPKNKRTVNIDEVINIVGIENIKNKFPYELSGGQKQRVAIARAILKQPEIMLCDEPTGALDDETSKNIIDLFLKVNKEFKTTIVMVTHNNSLVSIATKIIRIQDGKIVGIEEKDKSSNFQNPFTKNS